jgi:hypothetical protein
MEGALPLWRGSSGSPETLFNMRPAARRRRRRSFHAVPGPLRPNAPASVVETEPVPPSAFFAVGPGVTIRSATLRTLLEFKYVTPIDVNQTADISVMLRQELYAEWQRPLPGSTRTYEVSQLNWPVTLRLEGPGFDWTSNDIPLKQNTPLPASIGFFGQKLPEST